MATGGRSRWVQTCRRGYVIGGGSVSVGLSPDQM